MDVGTANVKASGAVYPVESFQFLSPTEFNPHDVIRVLRGEAAGCLFHGAIDQDVCARVARNFRDHPRLRARNDDVPAYFLGTYHYRKPLALYLEEAAAFRDTMHDVFDGCENVFQRVMSAVTSALAADGVTLRVAQHEGAAGSEFVMRSWSGAGQFSLAPHDDAAQLSHPLQRGFEIQSVAGPLVAFNMCLETPGAGELHYWNIVPDEATRVRLGLQETGYPYPLDVLEGIDRLIVPIQAGDIYFFNGKNVHAVGPQRNASGYRSTISGLMGVLDKQTVIYWS